MALKHWHNWAINLQYVANILTPHTQDELVQIVQKAHQEHAHVKAYGTAHSWSDIAVTDGYLINTDKLNKIISVDHKKNQVTVQAGIKLKDLNQKLAKLGLCLSNQGAIVRQSLAGVVSTATHGSGKTGTFASFITQVRLLTADGSIKTISKTLNHDIWDVCRTSMGTLGIMTELTVQCEPLFKVARTTKNTDFKTIMQEYTHELANNDYMQFTLSAQDDSVEVTIHNRTTKNSSNSGFSYEMLAGVLNKKYVEIEIAIPMVQFEKAGHAAHRFLKKAHQQNKEINAILFRFVAAEEENLMSPASDQAVCYFSITVSPNTNYMPYFKEFYNLMLEYDGRPHWGKMHFLNKSDVKKLYQKNYSTFAAIRKKLDPKGMFSNDFTKRVFGW